MTKKLTTTICLLFFLFGFTAQAQEEKSIADMTIEDYIALQLPSLETLFENAKNSSRLAMFDTSKEIESNALRRDKRAWLKFLSVGGAYSYGKAGIYSSYSDINTPLTNQYSGNAQNNYNVGVSVSIPFELLFDMRPNVKRQELRIKMIQQQKEQSSEQLKSEIIEQYTKAVSSLAILKLKIESVVFANAQYKMGENDFLNGRSDVNSLNSQKSAQMLAKIDYENVRSELNKALLKLEVMTNTKIFNKNTNKK